VSPQVVGEGRSAALQRFALGDKPLGPVQRSARPGKWVRTTFLGWFSPKHRAAVTAELLQRLGRPPSAADVQAAIWGRWRQLSASAQADEREAFKQHLSRTRATTGAPAEVDALLDDGALDAELQDSDADDEGPGGGPSPAAGGAGGTGGVGRPPPPAAQVPGGPSPAAGGAGGTGGVQGIAAGAHIAAPQVGPMGVVGVAAPGGAKLTSKVKELRAARAALMQGND
jgi:hypothetical protein